jgi:hypothetical protein
MKCSICKKEGHNKRSCKKIPVSIPNIELDTDIKAVPLIHSDMPLLHTIEYPHIESLRTMCKGFIGEKINLITTFKGRSIPINNVNIVGDLLEDVFFPFYKDACPDFEEGPKQESPDFFAYDKEFQFEQKVFCGSPGFDISNFTSLVHQISKPGGLIRKLFKTKYLVYEYTSDRCDFIIKDFWLLNIWDLPVYDKTYPISVQVKKNMWYNLRPGAKSGWRDSTKTPSKFLEKLISCIDICEHLCDKDILKASIIKQMEEAKTLGFL